MLFRSKKAKRPTPYESLETFRRAVNDALDAAEKGRVGLGELVTALTQTSETLKYRMCVSAASSYHTHSEIVHIGR
jgi:hypothetical protein